MALTWMRAIVAAMLLPHCVARAARPAGLKALLLRTRAGASSSEFPSSSTSALHMASSTSTTASTTTSPAAAADKLAALRRALAASQVDCFIVPTDDPHMSEYTALHYNRREWLSGFTGSAGTAVVTQTDALLFTDGRYHNQAELELPKDHWTLMRQGLKEVRHCAGKHLSYNGSFTELYLHHSARCRRRWNGSPRPSPRGPWWASTPSCTGPPAWPRSRCLLALCQASYYRIYCPREDLWLVPAPHTPSACFLRLPSLVPSALML